jgi:D-alanyl-D-alanine carboxypeptidase (penicillin-binding protein 5/6)
MTNRQSVPGGRPRPDLPCLLPIALALLLLMMSGPSVASGHGASLATVLDQDEPATATAPAAATLAERWVVPDGLAAPPDTSAQAVFAGDIGSGQVLFASNADEERAPASTAKIATSLTLVDVLTDLRQVVTIEQDDTVDITVFSNAQLETGDEVTVEGLLYGLMLPSGNDAARALARVAGQTIDPNSDDPTATFLDAVNARVADLGAANTVILNPAGEDTDGQHTTARDLAILAAALLDNETLTTIVGSQTFDMQVDGPDARTVTLTNTNQLLGEDGIIGVKTGSTPDAGACLVTGAQFSSSSRVIIVVLGSDLQYDANDRVIEGSDSRYVDSLAIIRAIPQAYTWVDLNDPNGITGLAAEAAAWQVGFGPGTELVVPKDKQGDVKYRMVLGPVGKSGDAVGRVLFFIGDKQIADQPVYQL